TPEALGAAPADQVCGSHTRLSASRAPRRLQTAECRLQIDGLTIELAIDGLGIGLSIGLRIDGLRIGGLRIDPQSPIPNPQSPIGNPQSPIPNPQSQSAICNPNRQSPTRQSALGNPQSVNRQSAVCSLQSDGSRLLPLRLLRARNRDRLSLSQ